MRQQSTSCWDLGMNQELEVSALCWNGVGEEKEYGGGASGTATMIVQL